MGCCNEKSYTVMNDNVNLGWEYDIITCVLRENMYLRTTAPSFIVSTVC